MTRRGSHGRSEEGGGDLGPSAGPGSVRYEWHREARTCFEGLDPRVVNLSTRLTQGMDSSRFHANEDRSSVFRYIFSSVLEKNEFERWSVGIGSDEWRQKGWNRHPTTHKTHMSTQTRQPNELKGREELQNFTMWTDDDTGGPCKPISLPVGSAKQSKHEQCAKQSLLEEMCINQQDPKTRNANSRFNKFDAWLAKAADMYA